MFKPCRRLLLLITGYWVKVKSKSAGKNLIFFSKTGLIITVRVIILKAV
jgi:hypothetical protein